MIKRGNIILTFIIILVLIIVPLISAGGFSNFWGKITGKVAEQAVGLNISVGTGNAPVIKKIYNGTMNDGGISTGPNEGPTLTIIAINFSVVDAQGTGNLNSSSAKINFSKLGESTRSNASCVQANTVGNVANYTCNVTMWWFDGAGTDWNISAYIKDTTGNVAYNVSAAIFSVGTTDGLVSNPDSLGWATINAGATDTLSNTDPILLNNTGNVKKYVEINSTHLKGWGNANYVLWAGQFSVNAADACDTGTTMTFWEYANITSSKLPDGNFSINDGSTGQEQLYFCLETSDSNLTTQEYTTGIQTWTAKIVNM